MFPFFTWTPRTEAVCSFIGPTTGDLYQSSAKIKPKDTKINTFRINGDFVKTVLFYTTTTTLIPLLYDMGAHVWYISRE